MLTFCFEPDQNLELVAPALLQHGQRVVVRARVKAIGIVPLLESLVDGLDVNTRVKVVLGVVAAHAVLKIVLRLDGADDGGLVVPSRTEDGRSLGSSSDTTTGVVAERTLHGVLLTRGVDESTCVESGQQRVDVELGKWQVEDQMKSGSRSQEENEIDDGEDRGKGTRLEGHSDELGDDVVSGSETGSRLVKSEDKRTGNEHVGKSSETEPQDDDDLELLELFEEENDLDTNSSTDGTEERDDGTNSDESGHDLGVHQLVHSPSEEELGGQGKDTSHDGVGSESAVGPDGVSEVAKVRDEVLVHEYLIEYGVDGIGDDEEEDKVPHERLVVLELSIVDVSLYEREAVEPNVEHDTDVHATQRKVHGGELHHGFSHFEGCIARRVASLVSECRRESWK